MAGVDHDTLAGWLTGLQLSAIRDQLDNLLDEAAQGKLTLHESLAMLVEREVSRRTNAASRWRSRSRTSRWCASSPTSTSMRSRASTSARFGSWRRRGGWRTAALLVLGPSGVGKSHLAIALGREAIRQSYSVLFTTAQALMAALIKAHSEGRLDDRLAFYAKAETAHRRRLMLSDQ